MVSKKLARVLALSLALGGLSFLPEAAAAGSTTTVTTDWTLQEGEKIDVSADSIKSIRGVLQKNSSAPLTITNSGDTSIIAVNNLGNADGIYRDNSQGILTIAGTGKMYIEATGKDTYGIFTRGVAGSLDVKPEISMKVTTFADNTDCVGIYSWSGTSTFAKKVTIDLSTDYNTVRAYGIENVAGKLTFNGDVDVTVTTTKDLTNSWGYATAIESQYDPSSPATTDFYGDVKAYASGATENAYIFGVDSLSYGTNVFHGKSDITAVNTKGVAVALYAQDNGSIQINDSTKLEAQGADAANSVAVYSSTNSLISLGKISESTAAQDAIEANITGNVVAEKNSKTNLNLTGSKSILTGATKDNDTSKVTLALHDKATWNNTGVSDVNNLIMNQGIVKQSTIENNTILVNNYSGRGTVQYQGRVTEGVLTATGAKITIENAALGSSLVIASASDGTNTLDKNKAAESLESLAAKLVYTGDTKNLAAEAVINEGLITPRTKGSIVYDVQGNASVDTSTVHWEADKVDSGNESTETPGTPGTTETTTMSAMKNIAAVNLMAWREENNNLTKRLGDLRISDQEQGLWARMYRGEFEYSGTYKNQHNTFQIGYDKKISQKDGSSWFVGGAVSHTDGKTSYTNGNGENKSNGLAVYGTWLGTKGHYLDLIVKQSRLSTDFDTYVEAGHTHGDYNNWGTSLSTEYGRRLQLKNAWFVEPQVEFTIGRISSADYTTNNDIMVSQDALYSKVGRVGFRIGKALTKKSQIYAYGSLLHEFGSDGHTYLKLNGISNSYLQEIGNTWYEVGVGGNFSIAKGTQAYMNVEKTFGDKIKTPWQWNAGVRWNF